MLLLKILHVFLSINIVFGGVLILSPKKTEVSGLKPFDEVAYQDLRDSFKKTKIISFKINSEQIPADCERLLQNKHTAYVPNVVFIPENVIVLNKNDKQNCDEIKKKIRSLDLDSQKNIIYLIIHEPIKVKRSIESSSTVSPSSSTTEESTTKNSVEKALPKERPTISPDEPVLYDSNGKAMVYSSRAPILRVQNYSETVLGPATWVTVDDRDTYSRLICSIPVDDGKVTLRFRFSWESGYWSLTFVEVVDQDGKMYNLTNTREVFAPKTFSHRCGGETVFSDSSTTLTLFDLQAQPRTKERRFSDAYNCVPFMTAPIWSGILVTSILAIGLTIGLCALGSIKTMDKFDNSKTKQLTITIIGE